MYTSKKTLYYHPSLFGRRLFAISTERQYWDCKMYYVKDFERDMCGMLCYTDPSLFLWTISKERVEKKSYEGTHFILVGTNMKHAIMTYSKTIVSVDPNYKEFYSQVLIVVSYAKKIKVLSSGPNNMEVKIIALFSKTLKLISALNYTH